jgi:hypothetical protein
LAVRPLSRPPSHLLANDIPDEAGQLTGNGHAHHLASRLIAAILSIPRNELLAEAWSTREVVGAGRAAPDLGYEIALERALC